MSIEESNRVSPVLAQQACHRFFYLHESRENVMAQLNISSVELEMALRRKKQQRTTNKT